MIRFQGVSKHFEGCTALEDVSFELHGGELAFLTGHSGAGKSTLLSLIMLEDRPSVGDIWLGNQHLNRLKQRHIPRLRQQMGVVFQDHALLLQKTVFDNVALPLRIVGMAEVDIRRRVSAALDKVGLLHRMTDRAEQLSGGEQQRVGIARAVVNRPALLLADEPTGNLDSELASDIMALFDQFRGIGVTVLIATHDHALIHRTSARVLSLSQGRLQEQLIA